MTTLLLDMDGPLAAFDLHFWNKCQMLGIRFDVDGPHQQTAQFFTDHIPDRHERSLARHMVDTSHWFRDLPVTAGAKEGVDELLALGVDIWVCTKPLEANRFCRDDKAAWLAEHFPSLAGKLILAPNKSMIVGDVLLDDAPKPEWCDAAPWWPVIFSTTYNGAGTKWAEFTHWTWGDNPDDLLAPWGYDGSPFPEECS